MFSTTKNVNLCFILVIPFFVSAQPFDRDEIIEKMKARTLTQEEYNRGGRELGNADVSIRLTYEMKSDPGAEWHINKTIVWDITAQAVREESRGKTIIGTNTTHSHEIAVTRVDSPRTSIYDIEEGELDDKWWSKETTGLLPTQGAWGPDLFYFIQTTELKDIQGVPNEDHYLPCELKTYRVPTTHTVCYGELLGYPLIVYRYSFVVLPDKVPATIKLVNIETDMDFPAGHFILPRDRKPTPLL